MYRGKDIGNREELIQTCLVILGRGSHSELYDLLPHISIVRSPSFFAPLVRLLKSGDRRRKEFAALALGSLADARAVGPLVEAFRDPETLRGPGTQSLQSAIIIALGDLGDRSSIEPLVEIYETSPPGDHFSVPRRRLVLAALGVLAQQGVEEAEQTLIRLMGEAPGPLQACAVTELVTAYWHRPNELPGEIFEEITRLTKSPDEEIRTAAMSALSNLVDLGCTAAEELVRARS